MRILLLCSAFNRLSQRVWIELRESGHGVSVQISDGDESIRSAVAATDPDLVICHLDDGATLNMELTVDIGKGYVPAAANRPADAPGFRTN